MGVKVKVRLGRARQVPSPVTMPLHGRPGHFDGVRPGMLEAWRNLGEVGQFLVGSFVGYSRAEIQYKRRWTNEETDRYELEAIAWLDKNGRKP